MNTGPGRRSTHGGQGPVFCEHWAVILRLAPYLRVTGLMLLVAGLVLTLAWSAAVGLAVVGLSALFLAVSHPLIAQRARSRAGRRAAAQNGRPGPALPEDVDAT